MSSPNRASNWVFLGDSLTEGVGSLRATYVTELVNRLRKKHEGGEDVFSGADVEKLTNILAGRVPEPTED